MTNQSSLFHVRYSAFPLQFRQWAVGCFHKKPVTFVIRTSKNPVFDETFEFVISQEELAGKHLEVSVCEERVIKNEPIEKVVIDLDKLGLVLPYTKLFRLSRKSHES